MHKFVAVGGTFDHFHKGHKKLILTAFSRGEFVIIGITSDEFLRKINKPHDENLCKRICNVIKFLSEKNLIERTYFVVLNDPYGPIIKENFIEGIIVTRETLHRAEEANKIRESLGMSKMNIYLVDYELAADGIPISSTRIRNKEIDEEGNLIK